MVVNTIEAFLSWDLRYGPNSFDGNCMEEMSCCVNRVPFLMFVFVQGDKVGG